MHKYYSCPVWFVHVLVSNFHVTMFVYVFCFVFLDRSRVYKSCRYQSSVCDWLRVAGCFAAASGKRLAWCVECEISSVRLSMCHCGISYNARLNFSSLAFLKFKLSVIIIQH